MIVELKEIDVVNELDEFLKLQTAETNQDEAKSYWTGSHIYQIEVDKKVVGYVSYDNWNDCYCLSSLIIKEEYQHKGIGTNAIRKISYLLKKKTKLLYGFVDCNNEKAIKFYQKQGCKFLDVLTGRYILDDPIFKDNENKYEFAVFVSEEKQK